MIQGLVDGIEDKIGSAVTAVSNALSGIRDLFPNSPAKKGPFSGKGWVLYSGMSISDSFADGIVERAAEARKAAEDLARQTQGALSGVELQGPVINQRTLNYHAAPGSSLSAEEDLFAAANRGRMVNF
jgi:hypothetical protein